jgi:hypothetical protein
MKTSHFLALPLLLVVLHLSSCESIVTDVELPKADPVLTVYGFVSPDEPHINIRVGRSMPIYTRPVTGSDTVADAVVTLYCDGRSVQIPYRGQSWYSVPTGSFPIPPGSTCSLVVTTPRGERVTGQTLIPNQFAAVVRSELVQVEDPFGFNQDFVQVFWDDLPGTDDYYHFIAREVSIFSGDTNRYVQASEVIDSRDARNGQFSARIPVYLNGGTPGDSAHFELALATTGRDYYRYHLLRLDYFGDNPFAEPTVMHRNVEGGEGVFAGYRCKSVRLKIPYRSTP